MACTTIYKRYCAICTPQADQRKAKFYQPEGDHLTLLAVYEQWKASKFSVPWCKENFIQVGDQRHCNTRGCAGSWEPSSHTCVQNMLIHVPRPHHHQGRSMKRAWTRASSCL